MATDAVTRARSNGSSLSSPVKAAQSPSTSTSRRSNAPHKPLNAPAAANTLADLTSCVRRTTGAVPPGLVGFSSTTIGDKLYVFGGRLVHVRRMVNELRALDLNTLVWEKLWPPDDAEDHTHGPQPRYFHSADAWGHKLVIFGGMGQAPEEDRPESSKDAGEGNAGPDPNLSVLSDLLVYDTIAGTWEWPQTHVREGVEMPLARYAHLSSISNGCLVILGGQDILNRYIEQMCCLELDSMNYVQNSDWHGHAGTYRSVAVSRHVSVDLGGAVKRPGTATESVRSRTTSMMTGNTNFDSEFDLSGLAGSPIDESLQLPHSTPASPEEPVYTFTNYNFADVRRALDLISAPSSPDWTSSVTSLSDLMAGAPSLPPGLRFPTASMIGSYLVLTGTLITQQMSSFAIWTLDLGKAMTAADAADKPRLLWQKIDAGHALKSGSWNRAVAWRNSVVILGDRDRDIAIDYNRRQNNFTHIVFVDLETFGIYQPPPMILPHATQEFGLNLLSQPMLADFDVICTDGVRLPCSRGVLEDRWPWFKEELASYVSKTEDALRSAYSAFNLNEQQQNGESGDPDATIVNGKGLPNNMRVSPGQLILPENSQVGAAILQYFYTLNLITSLQHSTPVLVSLLLFGKNYGLTHLRALVVHAFHVRLTTGQASPAVVYEAAALGGCIALQTRALKMMMNANAKTKLRSAGPTDAARRPAETRT